MAKSSAPCFNCADRKLYCHSKCVKYSAWKDSKEDPCMNAERSYNEYERIKRSRISRSMQRQEITSTYQGKYQGQEGIQASKLYEDREWRETNE